MRKKLTLIDIEVVDTKGQRVPIVPMVTFELTGLAEWRV
jgi:hypothetical protein